MSVFCGLAAFAALAGANTLPPGTHVYFHGANQPFCVQRNGISFCFAPGTSAKYVQKVIARLPPPPPGLNAAYQPFQRWSNTASGTTGAEGNPLALTYSFVPDGTALPSGAGESPTASNLSNKFNAAFASAGGEATWKAKIRAAVTSWSNFGSITYTEVPDEVNPSTGNPYSLPNNSGRNTSPKRGDVRISGHTIDGQGGILAYNYFPNTGDMVIDTADTAYFTLSSNDYRFLRNTIAHEHGHGLGFDHSDPINGTKLMEAYLNTGFDGQQDDDVRAVQHYYGDRYENNDTVATAKNLGTLTALTTFDNLSTDSATDQDWYQFSVDVARNLSVSTLPVGSTYQIGPLAGALRTVNTLQINKISFDVYASDGTTLLARRNTAAIGTSEVLTNLSLVASGGLIYIKVYNSTSVADVQRYKLEVNATPGRTFSGTIDLEECINKAQTLTFDFRIGIVPQFTRTVTLDATGGFSLGDIPANNYTVSIKGAKWLRRTVNVNVTASDYPGFTLTLRAGDSDNDNIVDVADLLAIINTYNKQSGQSGFSDATDFNCDGKDDVADLLLVIGNYNQLGDN